MTGHDSVPIGRPYAGWAARLSRRGLLGSGIALAAGEPSLGRMPRLATAHQVTPMATPTPEVVEVFVQFSHFEKYFAFFGVVPSEDQLAALYGLTTQPYRAIRTQFDANARQAATQLLADPALAERVDRLPFAPGDTVVGLGDSITDDLQSWLEILRHVLTLRRPHDQIQIVNHGISGDTTTDALLRGIPIMHAQPAWILCMLGTNDAIRYGRHATKTLVSHGETAANLAELRHLAATERAANWVWLTPPPCDEERIAADPGAVQAEMHLGNADLEVITEGIRDQPDLVVDVVRLFGSPPGVDLLMSDGIHPSLLGQQAITRAVIERLTA